MMSYNLRDAGALHGHFGSVGWHLPCPRTEKEIRQRRLSDKYHVRLFHFQCKGRPRNGKVVGTSNVDLRMH